MTQNASKPGLNNDVGFDAKELEFVSFLENFYFSNFHDSKNSSCCESEDLRSSKESFQQPIQQAKSVRTSDLPLYHPHYP